MPTVLEDVTAAVAKCNRCGFCQAGCPTYKATGVEWSTARGRLALIKDVLEGRIELDEEVREPIYTCLQCGGCTSHCFPAIETADIMSRAREELVKKYGQHFVQKLIFKNVLPHPQLLGAGVSMMRLAQVTGALKVAKATQVMRLMADAHDAIGVLPAVPGRTGRQEANENLRDVPDAKYKVAYFIGCAVDKLYPNFSGALVRVLQRNKVQVVAPEHLCCGKPPEVYGDKEAARDYARKNIDALLADDMDAIVTDCATCGGFLHEYKELLKDDPEYAKKAEQFADKVRDISEFLAGIELDPNLGEVKAKVTYHDPCHLVRSQKVLAQPRKLLKSIPGVEFVEMREADMCCGCAGSYMITHYEISQKILDRKIENAERTQADTLATGCPACMMQLAFGVKKHESGMVVKHTIELLDESYRAADRAGAKGAAAVEDVAAPTSKATY